MVVQHNMQAANANRMLNVTTSAQSKSTEKLSSGYRINRAADDAAGLTISEKMRKQIRGLDQASTNAQDGVSSVQTAEGALTEVHSMLQRMNELATQAANGTNSKDSEGEAGTKTINMKAHDAGLKGTLTDNGDGTATFVMDSLKDGDSVSIGGKTYTIGSKKADVDTAVAAKIKTAGDKFTVNGQEITIVDNYTADKAADQKAGNYTLDDAKALVKEGATVKVGTDEYKVMTDKGGDGIDDTDASVISKDVAYNLASKELLAANQIGDTKGSAKVENTNAKAADGSFKITTGQADVANSLSFSLHVGADADMTNKIQVNIDAMDSASLGIKGLDVKDASGNAATYAVDAISDAISKVSSQRSSLGAVQNRLEHTINNLDNVVENTTTAESRIRDTDMAEEMVNYSKNNILAQAGQSMLAQANQSNQGVLSLLQ